MPTRGQMGLRFRREDWEEMQDDRAHKATQEYIEKRDQIPQFSSGAAKEAEKSEGRPQEPTVEDWVKSNQIGWTERGEEVRKVFCPVRGKECWFDRSPYTTSLGFVFEAYLQKPDVIVKTQGGSPVGYMTPAGGEVLVLGKVPQFDGQNKIVHAWSARHVGGRIWTDLVALSRMK